MPGLLRSSPVLGPGPSPQELGSRRLLMEALAKQGRYDEAKRLNDEGYAVISELAKGKFAKHEQEEIEAMDEVKQNSAGLERCRSCCSGAACLSGGGPPTYNTAVNLCISDCISSIMVANAIAVVI